MSYILEALKKADAERERGAVPDLHAQPVPLAAAYEDQAPRGAKPWLWLAAGAFIALAGVLAWQFSGSEAPPGVMPEPPPAPAAAVAAPPAPPATLATPAPPPAPAAPPGPATQPAPPATSARNEAAPAPPRAPLAARPSVPGDAAPKARLEPRAPAVAGSAVAAGSAGSASSPAPRPAKAVPAQPAPTRAPLLSELPEDTRRQVPAMTIGGSVYSQQPANRMVIINGQVFREGSAVTPDLRLEQIGPRSAVFSLGGQRFEMPF